jgi:hypothetical protein
MAGHHGLRGGASPSGSAAHQESPSASDDAGEDRAFLEDAVGGVSVTDGVCRLRGLPAAARSLHRRLQFPSSASGDRGAGACGSLLPGVAAREGGDRAHDRPQRDGQGPRAAATQAVLSDRPARRPLAEHRGPGVRPAGAGRRRRARDHSPTERERRCHAPAKPAHPAAVHGRRESCVRGPRPRC